MHFKRIAAVVFKFLRIVAQQYGTSVMYQEIWYKDTSSKKVSLAHGNMLRVGAHYIPETLKRRVRQSSAYAATIPT